MSWFPVAECGCELGERPVWDPRSATVWWVDIPTGNLHALCGGAHTTRPVGAPLGAVALCADAGLVAASGDELLVLDAGGRLAGEPIPLGLGAGVRFNDGAVDPAGRMLIGTTSTSGAPGLAALYRIGPDHSVQVLFDGLTESNGLGWAPDGRTMYYVDSGEPVIRRYDYDPLGRQVRRRPDLVDIGGQANGTPDGLVVDADGAVWVALWGGAALRRYAPDGALIDEWTVPVVQPTCPLLAPTGMLYLTTAWEGLSAEERVAQPWAGHLLGRRLPCRPQPAAYFAALPGPASTR